MERKEKEAGREGTGKRERERERERESREKVSPEWFEMVNWKWLSVERENNTKDGRGHVNLYLGGTLIYPSSFTSTYLIICLLV